jgi:prevent-host-death family protein
MIIQNVAEAKAKLSFLIESALNGEDVVIARNGKAAVRLQPIEGKPLRQGGIDRGLIIVSDDFDDPLPDEMLAAFEGND